MLATTIHKTNTTPHHQDGATTPPTPTTGGKQRACCLRTQQCAQHPPNRRAPTETPPTTGDIPADVFICHKKYAPPATHYRHRHTYPNHHIPHDCGHGGKKVLLRKEVIQPHLPVRLPCYDFVPIADPTFDGSLHKG